MLSFRQQSGTGRFAPRIRQAPQVRQLARLRSAEAGPDV